MYKNDTELHIEESTPSRSLAADDTTRVSSHAKSHTA
jgi:hypothetical protein